MAFGHGYKPMETLVLKDGNYNFRIKAVREQKNNQGSYIEVELEAEGKRGYSPNKIFKNDIPVLGNYKANGSAIEQSDVDRWNKDMTTFFDCFGIGRGNFNFSQWVGKIGTCKVAPQYDPNEADKKSKKFKEITPIKPETDEAQLPVQTSVNPQETSARKGCETEYFPEDIPF